jgi:hypothetical protein
MAFREQVLGSTRSSLDALAQSLAREINTLHQSGVDAYGQTGKALFEFDPAMAHASAGLRITTKDPLNIAAAAAFRVIENASNTGTADAMVRYQAPAYAGAAALDDVLVNNSNAVAGAKLNVAANPGALPVSYIPAGMRNTTIYLDTLNDSDPRWPSFGGPVAERRSARPHHDRSQWHGTQCHLQQQSVEYPRRHGLPQYARVLWCACAGCGHSAI